MSVNPVTSIPSSDGADLADASLHRDRPAVAPPRSSAQPGPEAISTRNQLLTPASPAFAEIPEDEVEVQRDSEANGEIVIRYLDPSGNLVLQVPSAQVLGVARAVDQDLEREAAKAREDVGAAQPARDGGKL